MRVLFLAPQPFFRLRGVCLAHLRCLEVYSAAGAEVDLVSFPFGEPVALPGLRFRPLRPWPGVRDVPIGPSWSKALMDIPLFLEAARLCATRRYDFIHASEEAAVLGAVLGAVFGTRFIADMDEILSERLTRSGFLRFGPAVAAVRTIERWALSRAAAILTNSDDTTEYARRHGRARKVHFYDHCPPLPASAPDPEERTRLRRGEGWDGRDVLLYAGNLEPYQGVDLLVDSLPEILRRRPRALCVVIGGRSAQVERLRRRASDLGVGAALRAAGPRPYQETFRLLRAADVLVSPVVQPKAVPMKLYAYIASGTPIVATDVPNHAQLLDRNTLTPPKAEELARAVADALECRPAPRLAKAATAAGADAAVLRRVSELVAADA